MTPSHRSLASEAVRYPSSLVTYRRETVFTCGHTRGETRGALTEVRACGQVHSLPCSRHLCFVDGSLNGSLYVYRGVHRITVLSLHVDRPWCASSVVRRAVLVGRGSCVESSVVCERF